MADSTGNLYYSTGSSRISHSRHPSTDEQSNILPHLLAPLPCEAPFQPYLGTGNNTQNISVQFMHSCSGRDATQLNSDILQQRLSFDHETHAMAIPPIAYPESSQRTTSHALSPYPTDASRFSDYASCDLAALHLTDAPHPHMLRRGSWPSHPQMEYSTWMQTPQRSARSPASEPPESTSDESFQDSDVDDVTQMSPMMNQFQVQSSRHVDPPPQHMYHAQSLQPSVMTFQLSESMLQPVEDPENRHTLRRLLDMNIVADDKLEVTHPASSSTFRSPGSAAFSGAKLQGPSMRFQHDNEKLIRTSKYRVSVASSSSGPFPLPHSPANARVGDQRPTGPKQPKKSKMHQCEQCKKMFPRPSGLATHMNSHSGAKPYKCIVPNCDKSFAVRSNAKRHLRTHGINPSSPDALSIPRFTVGFEEPMVTQVHDAGRQPSRYRWITQNPTSQENEWGSQGSSAVDGDSRTVLALQSSMSSTASTLSNVSDDEYDHFRPPGVDARQYQSGYNRGTDEFPDPYPSYGKQSRRG